MYRDVIVELPTDDKAVYVRRTVRVEDTTVTEISDIVAMRLAYEYMIGDACANNELVQRFCRIAPAPDIVIGLDGKRR